MPRFRYRALRASGGEIEGEVSAIDEREAASRIQAAGSFPIEIAAGAARRKSPFARLSARELLLFTRQMAALLSAGVTPDRALGLVATDRERSPRARLAAALAAALERGESLSRALEAQRAVPRHYAAIVAAGEAQGNLGTAFERLATLAERNRAVGQALANALVYPASVLVVAVLSVSFLLGFVVPRFSTLLESFRTAPPLSMRFLLALSWVVRDGAVPLVVALILVAAYVAVRRRDPAFRLALSQRFLRLPHLGTLVAKVETERAALLLGTMIEAGVALPAALGAARTATGNEALRVGLAEAQRAVERGERLARALDAAGAVPPLALELVRVGEETGDLAPMLLKASDMLRKEVEATATEWIALLAPLCLVVLGLLVGLIAVALFGTVFEVYDFAS